MSKKNTPEQKQSRKMKRNLDKFDRVFGSVFKGLESLLDAMGKAEIPEEWLKKLAEKYLTEEEKQIAEGVGGYARPMPPACANW